MNPHFEAVLTTKMTLPFRVERGKGVPFSVCLILVVRCGDSEGRGGEVRSGREKTIRTVNGFKVVECRCRGHFLFFLPFLLLCIYVSLMLDGN